MKKIRLLVVTIALVMVSTMAFGQSIRIVDSPTLISLASDPVTVVVEWHRAVDGVILTQTVNTTARTLSSGIIVTAPLYWGIYSDILTVKIYVDYPRETHYAVYPGTATSADRIREPQYWIIVPK